MEISTIQIFIDNINHIGTPITIFVDIHLDEMGNRKYFDAYICSVVRRFDEYAVAKK